MSRSQNWVIRIIYWVCPDELQENIIGDLLEQYAINKKRRSKFIADWLLACNAVKFIRFSPYRTRRNSKLNHLAMLLNYLIVALRNFKKQRRYHTLNFIGLSLGLSCCALIVLYLDHELSYDDFHHDAENTFRVTSELNGRTRFPSIMNEYAMPLLTDEFPEIKRAVKFRRAPRNFAIYGERRMETRGIVTNPGSRFFEVFNFNVLEGSKERMLLEPKSAVLTETAAKRIFGEGPYIDHVFTWDTLSLKVTGVIEDVPSNSHLDFAMLVAADVPYVGVFAYVTLHQGADTELLEKKIKEIETGNENFYVSEVVLQPLEDIHYAKSMTFELKPPGNKQYLYLFVGIAIFILIISCTNYMNLSSAIYARRTKEMAVRRVLGSSRRGLASQFLVESILLTMLTIPIVLIVVEALLPTFSNLVSIPLKNLYLTSPSHLLSLLAIACITSVLAGLYPMLTMTHYSPLKLFKGPAFIAIKGLSVRKVLLTIQFVILLFLGTGAFFINKQLQFIKTKDLGINKTDIVKVSNIYDLYGTDKYSIVKSLTLESPHVIGFTMGTPPGTESFGLPYKVDGQEVRSDAFMFATDLDYFDVMGVQGLYGDFFQNKKEDLPNVSLVVNEKFVELMGWEDPIGKKVTIRPDNNSRDYYVSGVFKNYHSLSLHSDIVPQFIFARRTLRGGFENILVRIDMQNIRTSFDAIEEAWYSVMPNSPIKLEFLNEDIQAAYEEEQKAGELSLILSILAIFLAVLGLTGLASYLSELRIKEMGIRKVLGASFSQILLLLNKEFILIICIATLIAGSLSFFAVSKWLEDFAYRTSVEVFIFPLAGLIAFSITFLTISIQSRKAAKQNPVDSISHE